MSQEGKLNSRSATVPSLMPPMSLLDQMRHSVSRGKDEGDRPWHQVVEDGLSMSNLLPLSAHAAGVSPFSTTDLAARLSQSTAFCHDRSYLSPFGVDHRFPESGGEAARQGRLHDILQAALSIVDGDDEEDFEPDILAPRRRRVSSPSSNSRTQQEMIRGRCAPSGRD